MVPDLFGWPRFIRSEVTLASVPGVYALFADPAAAIPGFTPGPEGLVYIGKASGGDGYAGRCHFTGKTLNHSPRKSLAVLLISELGLEVRGHGGRKWGLIPDSDRRLSSWMHQYLRIAFFPHDRPEIMENRLICLHSPPLNLKGCAQTGQHRRISKLRSDAKADAKISARDATADQAKPQPFHLTDIRLLPPSGADGRIDSAPDSARRYGLDPKRFRGALRKRGFTWHILWNSWDVPRSSSEWRQVIEVAQDSSGRDLGELN